MEAFEIINYLSEFSSLNAAQLEEEIETCTEKIDEIEKELEHKLKVVQLLDEEITELKPIVDDLEVKSEKLEVEQIRVTTHCKKTKKDINKMNVDPSRATLDATDNDKQKLAILKAKLSLLRKLLNTFVNSDSQGFAFNPREMQLQLFQLNVNKPIEENRESLWNSIGNCSEHLDSWELLFQK